MSHTLKLELPAHNFPTHQPIINQSSTNHQPTANYHLPLTHPPTQPTNHHRSTLPSINQSINQPTNHSINQQIRLATSAGSRVAGWRPSWSKEATVARGRAGRTLETGSKTCSGQCSSSSSRRGRDGSCVFYFYYVSRVVSSTLSCLCASFSLCCFDGTCIPFSIQVHLLHLSGRGRRRYWRNRRRQGECLLRKKNTHTRFNITFLKNDSILGLFVTVDYEPSSYSDFTFFHVFCCRISDNHHRNF